MGLITLLIIDMPENFTIPYVTLRRPWLGFKGYQSDPKEFSPSLLSSPSVNCMVDTSGNCGQRLGFQTETLIDLTNPNNPATCFYLDEYDITVFATGTKVKYYDWTDQKVYDTGLTLTTGTQTRFDAYTGDVYLMNTTDGLRRLVFFRLNGAVSAGASSITIDADGAARLQVFSVTSGSLVIQGTSEAFTNAAMPHVSVLGTANNGAGLIRIQATGHHLLTGDSVTISDVVGTTEANGTWTVTFVDSTHFDLQGSTFTNAYVSNGTIVWDYSSGKMHLNTTASKSYADNAVGLVVSDISSGREKASKVIFWKERMILAGSNQTTNADAPNANLFFSEFSAALNLERITTFNVGTGGSVTELIGAYGRITNVVGAKDYLYTFKTHQAFSCAASAVVTDSSKANYGQTPSDLRDENNGCLNEDSACVVGDNEIAYITSDKRILRIKISTASGAAVLFPDESFDIPMRKDLDKMDADQTGARAFYHKGKHRAYFQVKLTGQWFWLIYDTTIGTWQPPQSVLFARDFFERAGTMYATDGSDDTVYSIGTTFDDDGNPIVCTMATCDFSVGSVILTKAVLQGEISQAAIVNLQSVITTDKAGIMAGSLKPIDGSTYTYSSQHFSGGIMNRM